MAVKSSICAIVMVAIGLAATPVWADETDGPRAQLDKVLAVLRVRTQAASKPCLNAMSQVHATEQQVKEHENDTGGHPELDIAHDVLESDYQNSSQICGADADRVCRESYGPDVAKACSGLHRDAG